MFLVMTSVYASALNTYENEGIFPIFIDFRISEGLK